MPSRYGREYFDHRRCGNTVAQGAAERSQYRLAGGSQPRIHHSRTCSHEHDNPGAHEFSNELLDDAPHFALQCEFAGILCNRAGRVKARNKTGRNGKGLLLVPSGTVAVGRGEGREQPSP